MVAAGNSPGCSERRTPAHQHYNLRPPHVGAAACPTASQHMNSITSAGFCLPVLLGHQLAIHTDHCPAGFGFGLWSDRDGSTTTWGIDAGRRCFRLVLDRVGNRRSTGWGLI